MFLVFCFSPIFSLFLCRALFNQPDTT